LNYRYFAWALSFLQPDSLSFFKNEQPDSLSFLKNEQPDSLSFLKNEQPDSLSFLKNEQPDSLQANESILDPTLTGSIAPINNVL
jgi:hypothetical protein